MLKDTFYLGDIQIKEAGQVLDLSDLQGYPKNQSWYLWHHVMCPGHLIARQKELDAGIENLSRYDPRPCLCSVFGVGEDVADRASSRIGGLPFWPKSKPWPTAQDGSAKEFLGQWDFRNIRWPEPLPGDVLTVHFDFEWDEDGYFDGPADGAAATIVWHNSRTSDDLIDREEVPPIETTLPIGPFYSRSVAVTDYKVLAAEESEYWQSLTIHGTKIGGHSPLYGSNWQEVFSCLKEPVFLCSLGSIKPPRSGKESAAWLPVHEGFNFEQASEMVFTGVAVFVVTYEKGDPQRLHWMCYMP